MKRLLLALATGLACAGGMAAGLSSRPLSELAIYPGYTAPARVEARDEARISAEVAGRIEALPARVGQAVARGGVLARIDDRSHRIELRRAQANLALLERRIALAESQLARAERLADARFVSQDALKVHRTELAVLGAERDAAIEGVAAARLALDRTVIRAPFDGVVRERPASEGELAAPGGVLLVLAASGGAEVRARVPLAQLAALRAAAHPTLVAAGGSHVLAIRRVSGLVDPAGQTREVVLEAGEALPPGLAGELRWQSTLPHLPPEYLQTRGGRLGAFVIEGGRPVFRLLEDAQAGRPTPVDWALDLPIVDQGRQGIGLSDAARP